MGTNYYAIPKVSEAQKKEIISFIYKDEFMQVQRLLPEQIHIGKSSIGWAFLFDHNNWAYFKKDLDTLKDFLSKCFIFDEYERPVTNDEFWKLVESKKDGHKHLFWKGEPCGTIEFGLNFSTSTGFS